MSIDSRKRLKFRFAAIVFSVFLACAAVPAGEARCGEEEAFSISTLSVADKLLDLLVEDINGDGLQDILAVHRKGLEPDETRWVSVFWQMKEGGFGTAADQSWEVDSTAALIDIGNVAGGLEKEICFLAPGGVRYYMIDSGKFNTGARDLVKAEPLTVFPSKRNLPIVDFVQDWNDDGIEETAIFTFSGLSILSPDANGEYSVENRISVELPTDMTSRRNVEEREGTSGISAIFRFPRTVLADFNSDGLRDLVVTRFENTAVYIQNGNKVFSETPSDKLFFDVRTQHEKIEENASVETVIHDLNKDGYADAIVTKQSSRGLQNFRSVINIYFGKSGGYPEKPDQVIISEGSASEATIVKDVNGDGRLDMILPSIKISVTAIIRFLLTRSVPINFNIFILNENNRYSDSPDFSKEVKFKIDFSGETDVQAVSLSGDYNGDRIKDFAFGTAEEELSIFPGLPGGEKDLFSKKPAARIKVPAFGDLLSLDLNKDNYDDMIIFYPNSKDRKGMIQVLMNRKKLAE